MVNIKRMKQILKIKNHFFTTFHGLNVNRKSGFLRSGFVYMICFITVFLTMIISVPAQTSKDEPIKIGLLIRDKNDIALINTAKLAIETANSSGGYKGQSFTLAYRSCDGPWGVGSKQAVDLMQDENVLLVVAALDGRNAHLAEQVAAKSHIVLLDALASDPTLSRAYVPWYYRMVPDDKQQAAALIEEIYLRKKMNKIAVVALDNYDGKMAFNTFSDKVKASGYPEPKLLEGMDKKQLSDELAKSKWDAVVLAGTPFDNNALNELILSAGAAHVYAFQNLFNFISRSDAVLAKVTYPKLKGFNPEAWAGFENRYKSKYKESPSQSMAFLYDGIMMAAESVRKYGPDSQAIKAGFKSLKFQGITGPVVFGSLGNREIEFILPTR